MSLIGILSNKNHEKYLKNQHIAYFVVERDGFLIFLKKILARFSEIPIMRITCLRQRNADLAQ